MASISNSKILGIITARGGSKGIPGKNIKELCGKPLIAYTIEAARDSGIFDRLILSTDDERIAAVARTYGCDVPFMRPPELAEDRTPHLPVVLHAVAWLKDNAGYLSDAVMILQPTAPLRQPFHIREAAELFQKTGADSIVSVTAVPGHYNPHWQLVIGQDQRLLLFTGEPFAGIISRRQDLPPTYTRNGAIYLLKTNILFSEPPSLYGDHVLAYTMDSGFSVNIDDPSDWEIAERAMRKILDSSNQAR
jgi:CMP-N-acetylneuraminic acid synthetase